MIYTALIKNWKTTLAGLAPLAAGALVGIIDNYVWDIPLVTGPTIDQLWPLVGPAILGAFAKDNNVSGT